MSATGFFEKFFRRQDDVASRTSQSDVNVTTDDFLRKLLQSQVFVLSKGSESSPDNVGQDQLLAHVKENAEGLKKIMSADSVKLFTYDLDGHEILPFFSSEALVRPFIQGLGIKTATGFYIFGIQFKPLLGPGFVKCHFVLNPNSPSQRHVSVSDRKRLCELAGQDTVP